MVVLGGPLSCRGLCTFLAGGAAPDKVVRALTDKAVLLLLFINLDRSGHPYHEPPFSIVCLTKEIRNVEAGVVIGGRVSIRCGLFRGVKPRVSWCRIRLL